MFFKGNRVRIVEYLLFIYKKFKSLDILSLSVFLWHPEFLHKYHLDLVQHL